MLGSRTDTRCFFRPEALIVWLFNWHCQPLLSPQSFDGLFVHIPTMISFLQTLQFLKLIFAQTEVLLLPAVIRLLSHVAPSECVRTRYCLPCQSFNLVAISSGLGRLSAMCFLRFPKYSGGPLSPDLYNSAIDRYRCSNRPPADPALFNCRALNSFK